LNRYRPVRLCRASDRARYLWYACTLRERIRSIHMHDICDCATTAGSPHGWGVMTAARCVFMLSITYTHPHTQAAAWIRIRWQPAAERVRLVSSSPPDVSTGGAAQAQAKPHATHKTGRARPKKG